MNKKLKNHFRNLFFATCLLLTFFACAKEDNYSGIKGNTTFNYSETAQIVAWMERFDHEICTTAPHDNTSLADCYHYFFKSLNEKINSNELDLGLEEDAVNRIMAPLSTELKKEFYYMDNKELVNKLPNANKTTFISDTVQVLRINARGKFFNFIETELVGSDSAIEAYYSSFKKNGTLMPQQFTSMIYNSDELNFENDGVRLFMMAHYLPISDADLKSKKSKTAILDDITKQFKER